MNIKEAKVQIKNAMVAYFTKNDDGEYFVPIEKQRPVFLMGPPGIGKTAIMEQVASEMGVGLLSYSMTHHTRQSALGLPFISHKTYQGVEYDISEYTMSEIIASVYDLMEKTGVMEGILFLDEINCVSETLAPIMLQFLQYKIFGRHRIPDGWIVVTAGNPPEYNNSVREFDIVTWDRLKRIDVEPDFDVWKEYAYQRGIHPSVLTYLETKKADFYLVKSTVEGKQFVTARGWEDLSQMIQLYERNQIRVDQMLIGQYLQNQKIARNFSIYYDLFRKYQSDYQVDKILAGKVDSEIKNRAKAAKFDERLALIGMLLDSVGDEARQVIEHGKVLKDFNVNLVSVKKAFLKNKESSFETIIDDIVESRKKELAAGKQSGKLSRNEQDLMKRMIKLLLEDQKLVRGVEDGTKAFSMIKKDFDTHVKNMKKMVKETGDKLTNTFLFLEEVFQEGQEILVFVTELTINQYSSAFISQYGCQEYFKHNKELLIHDRKMQIMAELEQLELE